MDMGICGCWGVRRQRRGLFAFAGKMSVNVLCGLEVPSADEVQNTGTLYASEHDSHVLLLIRVLFFLPNERRIPEDVIQLLCIHDVVPIDPQRVVIDDRRRLLQRQPHHVLAELLGHAQVHLVVHQPHRHLRDLGGELLDLDAVELVHVQQHVVLHMGKHRLLGGELALEDFKLQQPQFAIGDDEEVAAAAGGVQELQGGQLAVQPGQLLLVLAGLVEFRLQLVEEQGADQLEDVLLAGVVRAKVAAGLGIHHRLEHRAEDRRADPAPVQRARLQQQVAHLRVERGQGQGFLEQLAVDVGKLRELFVQRLLAALGGRVQYLEHLPDPQAQVTSVHGGALGDEFVEGLAREDAGVVGEQAEQQPHQQQLQRMVDVAGGLEGVV